MPIHLCSRCLHSCREHGKRIVITSDMYLSKAFLSELLQKNGYGGYEELYVSCEYEKSKAEGSLYEVVKRAYPDTDSMIHVGDNPVSDVKMQRNTDSRCFIIRM